MECEEGFDQYWAIYGKTPQQASQRKWDQGC